jgi:3-deoxy-7-phosphoheptulonate synthase
MAVVLTFAGGSPVVKVGRVAGQFAKPALAPTEAIDGSELPSYRATSSTTSPSRRMRRMPTRAPAHGLRQSAATLNLIRAFATAATRTSRTPIAGCSAS